MALTQVDRDLLELCLQRDPAAWERFINRFLPLFVHAIRHTAAAHSYQLSDEDIDEVASEIFAKIVANDFQILRQFRRKSSLATYLAVIARRVSIKEISRRRRSQAHPQGEHPDGNGQELEREIENRDQLDHLMNRLSDQEARIVRAFHLEGLSYREISRRFNIPENSIGALLSRARDSMRRFA